MVSEFVSLVVVSEFVSVVVAEVSWDRVFSVFSGIIGVSLVVRSFSFMRERDLVEERSLGVKASAFLSDFFSSDFFSSDFFSCIGGSSIFSASFGVEGCCDRGCSIFSPPKKEAIR